MARVKQKKAIEVPAAIKAFVDKVVSTPLDQVADALEGFTWNYEKGEFYHWLALFNYFDSFYDKFVKPRADLQLKFDSDQHDPAFPSRNVIAILRVSSSILENCSNKHLFQSYEHLTSLLAAPDPEVVTATLQTLVAFVRKTHASSVRWHGLTELNSRLLCLAQGWGGKEEGLELVACTQTNECAIQQGLPLATSLHFEFYEEGKDDAAAAGSRAGGQKVISLQGVDKYPESEQEILRQLVKRCNVPVRLRFALLNRIRVARQFASLSGRQQLVRMRLLAFYVLFQSNPNPEDMQAYFSSEMEFVAELVGLLQAEDTIPEDICTLALRALAVQLLDRARHGSVISAIGAGGQSGLLSMLMHRSVASLVGPGDSGVPQAAMKGRYSSEFVEALLSLVGALVASTSGCTALSDAGLIPALLPLLRDTQPAHVQLVSATVRILEAFMDFSPTAASLFRDLGGLTDMIQRLRVEVGLKQPDGAQPMQTDAGAAGTAGTSTAAADADKGKQVAAAPADQMGSAAQSAEAATSSAVKTIPYTRRLLLKSLLRAITLASYAPGSGARPQEEEQAELFACLRAMFERAREFGGGLFALAASVMTDLIHHDPLCYRALEEAGLPESFLKTIKAGVLPSAEALCCVPATLVALCLNAGGVERLQKSKALDTFIPIFTSKAYLRPLQGDTANILGAGLDELLRHVPVLRKDGVDMAVAVLRTLVKLGGGELSAPIKPAAPAAPAAVSATTAAATTPGQPATAEPAAAAAPEAMDTDTRPAEAAVPAEAAAALDAMETDSRAEGEGSGSQAAAASTAAAGTPQGDLEMAGTSTSTSPAEPAASGSELVLDAGILQAPQPEQGLYLQECVSHSARMLESLLANADTCRTFVESQGVELLLGIYRLPRLPPTFGSSSASQHSMLATFRALSPTHAPDISKHLSSALIAQVRQTLDKAQAVGSRSVPELPSAERDDYVRLVSSTEGLASLAAAVVRNAQHMLMEVSSGQTAVIARLGELERMVLWQLAVAEDWKLAHDAQKAAEAKAAEANKTKASAAETGAGEGSFTSGAAVEAVPAVVLDNDVTMAVTERDPLEDHDADAGADAPEAANGVDREASTTALGTKTKKKSPEELAYDVLLHFTTSTVRGFYTAVAKAIHTPVSRRRDELAQQPTLAMRAAAVNLGVVLRNNLTIPQAQLSASAKGKEVASEPSRALSVRYLHRVVEELSAVLFDARRHTCHTLALNYFVVGGGMRALLEQFQAVTQMLWQSVEEEKAVPEDTDMALTPKASSTPSSPPPLISTEEAAAKNSEAAQKPKALAEGLVQAFLGLLDQLASAQVLLGSPQAASMLVAPVPGKEAPAEANEQGAEAFVKNLQGMILAAVLPVWSHPLLPACNPRIASLVIGILTNCSQGTASAALRMGRMATARTAPQPDAAAVQQIVEMGFTQPRAEEALRRVGQNSVELAMEWLITHPEAEPAAATATPATAGASGASAGGVSAEEQELAKALAESLGQDPAQLPDSAAAALEAAAEAKAQVPGSQQLVDGAVAVLEKVPASAFALADLLSTLCSQNSGKERKDVLERLIHHLRGSGTPEEALASRSSASFLAPAHLLAVITSEDAAAREIATSAGLITTALDILDAWTKAHAVPEPDANAAQPSAHSKAAEVPSWANALLLILDVAVQAQPKAPSASAAPEQPGAVAADVAAAYRAAQPEGRVVAPEHRSTIMEAALAAIQAGQSNTGIMGAMADAHLQAMAASAAGSPAAPAPTAANAAPPSTAAEAQQPSQSAQAGPASSAAAAAGTAAGAAGTAGQPQEAAPAPPAAPKMQDIVKTHYRDGGLLCEAEQERAMAIALQLLRHLHSWGADWKLPAVDEHFDAFSSPDPASTAQAVLQLMARLSKRHSIALQVLAGKGHKLILDLPASCLLPELEPYMSAIMRHILEDPATLQAAMEAEIRNTLVSPAGRGRPGGGGAMPVRSFLSSLAPVLLREPSVFVEAMSATCSLAETGGRAVVILKPSKPEGKAAAEAAQAAGNSPTAAATPGPAAGTAAVIPANTGTAAATPAATATGAGAGTRSAAAATPASTRPAIGATPGGEAGHTLRRRMSGFSDRGGRADKEAPKSTMKGSKKVVPASFVEVIDSLVDLLLRYKGLELTPPQTNSKTTSPDAMETDTPSGSAVDAQAAQPAAQGQANPPPHGQALPRGTTVVVETSNGPMRMRVMNAQPLNGAEGGAAGQAPSAAQDLLSTKQVLNEKEREVLVQCIALKMLTDFTLMYSSCVGVLLKRDAELAGREAPHKTPAKGAHAHEPLRTGALIRHIMHAHLAHSPEPNWAMQGLAEQTSFFLLAVCIRSAEGRRRIIKETVKALTSDDSEHPEAVVATASTSIPFIQRPGAPAPFKVKAFVNLVGSLLSASTPGASSGNRAASTGLSTEMVRAMRDAGMVKALTSALKMIDLDHPKAPASINSILKPLEILTRNLPARLKPAADASPAAGGAGAGTADGTGAAAPTAQAAPPGQAAHQDAAMADREEEEEQRESAAGPEAVLAAERAMQAFERSQGHQPGGPSMEDVMEAFIEQAYANEGLEAFDEDSQGSSTDDEHDEDEDDDMDEGDGEGLSEEDDGEVHDSDEDDGDHDDEDDEDHDGDRHGGGHDHHDHGGSMSEGSEEFDDEDGVGDDEDMEEHEAQLLAAAAEEEEQALQDMVHHVGAMVGDEGDEDEDALDAEERDADLDDEEEGPGVMDANEEELEDGWQEEDDMDEEEDEEEEEEEEEEGATPRWLTHRMEQGIMDDAQLLRPGQAHALLDEVFGQAMIQTGDRVTRRRYRILPRRDGASQVATTIHPSALVPAQHRLLQRPNAAGGGGAAAGTAGAAGAVGGPFVMDGTGLRRIGQMANVMIDTGGMPGTGATAAAVAAAAANPAYSSMIDLSIDMLLGGIGAGGRPESRMVNWSDNGQPPTGTDAVSLIGSLERPMLEALRRNAPQPAPQPPPAVQQPAAAAAAQPAAAAAQQPAAAEGASGAASQPVPAAAAASNAAAAGQQPSSATADARTAGTAGVAANAAAAAPTSGPTEAGASAAAEPAGTAATAATAGGQSQGDTAMEAAQDQPAEDVQRPSTAGAAGPSALAPPRSPQHPPPPPPSSQVSMAANQGAIAADLMSQALQAAMASLQPPAEEGPPDLAQDESSGSEEYSDEEMMDADQPPSAEALEAAAAAVIQAQQQDQDTEMGTEAAPGAGLDPGLIAAAQAVGIDLAFLEALPPELRAEILAAEGGIVPPPPAQPTAEPQPAQPQPAAPQPAAAEQPAAADISATQPTDAAPAAAAPSSAAGGSGAGTAAAAPAAPAVDDGLEGIDPEFIAALPPDIREEVLEQQRRERRRLQAEAQQAAAQQAAAAAGPAAAAAAADMDLASVLASFPPEVREEALLTADEAMLAQLPPALLAEAQALRERISRHIRDPAALGRNVMQFALGRQQPGGAGRVGLSHLSRRADVNLASQEYVNQLQALRTRAAGAGAKKGKEVEGPPQVDEDDLVSLAQLLRLAQPLGKGQLQRVFLNLCSHSQTRAAALRILMSMLRTPSTADEPSAAQQASTSAAASAAEAGRPSGPASLAAALEQEQSASTSGAGEGSSALATSNQLFGLQSNMVYARSREPQGVPPVVARRLLDMLTYLARHQSRVARDLVHIHVPKPQAQAKAIAAIQDPKGKGKAVAEQPREAAASEERAIEVVLELLGRTLCRRSNSHLETALHLLEVVLRTARAQLDSLTFLQTILAEKEQTQTSDAATAATAGAPDAVAAADLGSGGGAALDQPSESATTAAAGAGSAATPTPTPAAASRPGSSSAQAVQTPALAGTGAAAAAEGTTPASGIRPATPTTPGPVAGVGVDQPGAGAAAGGSAEASSSGSGLRPADLENHEDDPRPVLNALPEPLLRQLPSLLGQQGLSELAYTRVGSVLKMVVEAAPAHKALMLQELEAQLRRLAEAAVAELRRLMESELLSSTSIAPSTGSIGLLVLRILQAVAALTKTEVSSTPRGAIATGTGGTIRETSFARAADAPEADIRQAHAAVARGELSPLQAVTQLAAAGTAVVAAQQRTSRQPPKPPQQPAYRREGADAAIVEEMSAQLEPLWQVLSQCIARIEAGLQATSAPRLEAAAAARILPTGAAQILPLVEAFFVLTDARTAHLPPTEMALLRSASVSDVMRAASSDMFRLPSMEVSPTTSAASQPSQAAPAAAHAGIVEAHLPFLRFAEKHRRLLNTLLRQNPGLLESSLSPLLKTPRLIEFDNKRAYFRTRVRTSPQERAYGTLRILVRREHVFEDSFHQLRMRSPEEMRCKLSVQFQAEEGIDAGGVSREWYSVMAREIFNPNFSLFVHMPEHGTTFQPNPNSVVQNDEARGTNHLDFFKFVGRIIGKALYDGQFIDAYFTRSFYKHMLGQALTYLDIEAVDPEYFKNLVWMLENDITDVLDLTFTEEADYFGKKELVELKPGGAAIKVTEETKREYVDLVAQHRMTGAIKAQINSFLTGFWDLIPKNLVSIFNDHELELLISGLPEIDVDDLRRNTEYTGFSAATPVIQWFWDIVRDLDKEDLALLVQFVTGTSKVPLEGFKALQGISGPQKFQIHKAYGPGDRLPSAHTCFNQLDLIEYETKEQLRDRLMVAIHEGSEGFGFG